MESERIFRTFNAKNIKSLEYKQKMVVWWDLN